MKRLFILLMVLMLCGSTAVCENAIYWDVVRAGTSQSVDTIYVGGTYDFQVSIANDFCVCGMSLGVEFSSPDGAELNWVDSTIYFVPGCRLIYPEEVFNLTGILITWYNFDGVLPEVLLVGGVANELSTCLQPGPAQPMINYRFRPQLPESWEEGVIGTLCMDSAWYINPCSHGVVFVDEYGSVINMTVQEELCLPVKVLCGNPNADGDINVGDVVFLANYIFKGGTAPNPLWVGDANVDGEINVGDVVFLVAAAFRTGPQPTCPDYVPDPPALSPGPDTPTHDSDFELWDILCEPLYGNDE